MPEELANQIQGWQIFEAMKHKVLLCIPFGDTASTDTLGHLLAIVQKGWLLYYRTGNNVTVHRNEFAMELLRTGIDYLIMLDADHAHPDNIVERLLTTALKNKEIKILSGLNYRRGVPYEPMAYVRKGEKLYRYEGDFDGESLYSVDAVATCAMLVHREVFETVAAPWFSDNYDRCLEHVFSGEDIYFSKKVKAAGFKIWVDSSLTSPHRATTWIDREYFQEWKRNHELPVEAGQ
jgi:GT2 family glycosyltransferase